MYRLKMFKIALVLVVMAALFQNCAQTFHALEGSEDEMSLSMRGLFSDLNQKTKIAPHLDYFGYYASAYNADYIDEVKDHTNIIFAAHYDDDQLVQILNHTEQNGLRAIVLVQYYFYSEGSGVFRSDAMNRWQKVAPKLKPFYDRGVILSFYIDEPELYARVSNTLDKLPVELPLIAKTVRTSFPDAKMQMTSSFFDVKDSMYLPAEFDYFGFDCYDSFESCGEAPGTYYTKKSIPEMYAIVEGKVRRLNEDGKSRRIFLFPPTSFLSNKGKTAADAIAIFDKYVQFAKEKPLVLGLLSFLWATHRENSDIYVGARDDQTLRGYLTQFGKNYVVGAASEGQTGSGGADTTNTPQQTPQILNSGLGCDDDLCIWAVVKDLSSSFRVVLVNPTDGPSKVIVTQAQIYRKDYSGSDAISFRIPGEYLDTYSRKGVLVSIENIYTDGNTTASFQMAPPKGTGTSGGSVEPSTVSPEILGQGLGCDDNMCIWFTSRNLNQTYQVTLLDPQNSSARFNPVSSVLYRRLMNGVDTTSFPIPAEARSIYQSRGLRVLVENVYSSGNTSSSFQLSAPQGNAPGGGGVVIEPPKVPPSGNVVVESPKVTPEVTGQGLGCDDNMCIWFTNQNLNQSYQVALVDPQNGSVYRISLASVYRRAMSGSDTVSFPIPNEVRSIYQSRGVRVLIENIYSTGNTSTSFQLSAPKGSGGSVVVEPPKATPEVTGQGLGCDDNMCIWFTSRNLNQSYKVTLIDPQNGSVSFVVSTAILYRRMMNGAETVSFPIPSEARSIFLSRGIRVVIENIYSTGNTSAVFQVRM